MGNGIKFILDFPGLESDELEQLVDGIGEIKRNVNHFDWTINPFNEKKLNEFKVCQSNTVLMDSTENTIYLHQPSELKFLRDAVNKSGLFNLLSLDGSKPIFEAIRNRLKAVFDRLKQKREVYIFAAHRNAPKSIRYCSEVGIKVIALVDNNILDIIIYIIFY